MTWVLRRRQGPSRHNFVRSGVTSPSTHSQQTITNSRLRKHRDGREHVFLTARHAFYTKAHTQDQRNVSNTCERVRVEIERLTLFTISPCMSCVWKGRGEGVVSLLTWRWVVYVEHADYRPIEQPNFVGMTKRTDILLVENNIQPPWTPWNCWFI